MQRAAPLEHSFDGKGRSWRERDFLSSKEVAEILSISRNSAYELIHRLPHVRIGKAYRVSAVALENWIRNQERKCAR